MSKHSKMGFLKEKFFVCFFLYLQIHNFEIAEEEKVFQYNRKHTNVVWMLKPGIKNFSFCMFYDSFSVFMLWKGLTYLMIRKNYCLDVRRVEGSEFCLSRKCLFIRWIFFFEVISLEHSSIRISYTHESLYCWSFSEVINNVVKKETCRFYFSAP